jgi:serine/threonine-protein kinase
VASVTGGLELLKNEENVSESYSCKRCGSDVPADAPDGICPACQRCAAIDVEPSNAKSVPAASTASIASTVQTSDGDATVSIAPESGALSESPLAMRTLGNYDLLEELGRGGMGVVYKAVQRRADRLVAVKLILGGAASGQGTRERFQSEVQALAKLRHPNIVPVFEVGDEEGCPYFSMEYMPGGSLAEHAKRARLPAAEAAAIVEQLAGAVGAAHAVGVLHRDIKPGNVLLDQDGVPKLTDFGLAKRMDRDEGLTYTGLVLGTPGYMPPEQARGERELTPAADVYSLGATFFALLTGRPPFAGQSFQETLNKVLEEDPPRLRTERPDVAGDLEAVCLKCLEKDPARRYATAQALADDLARWRQGVSTVARPQSLAQRVLRQARRKLRTVAIAAGLVVSTVLAVVFAAMIVNRMRDPLVAIDASLARGERVVLIGATGNPKWHKWELGSGSVSDTALTFEVFCFGTGYVELAPSTRHAHFRLSAEFQSDESTERDSWAGVYFGRTSATIPEGQGLRAIEVRLFDDRATLKPLIPGKGDSLSVQDFLRVSAVDEPAKPQGVPLASGWLLESPEQKQAVPPHIKPWRRLVVEVQSDGIRTRLFPSENAPPVKASPYPTPLEKLPQRPIALDARGGCGLLVRNARVYFRNVILEPLP